MILLLEFRIDLHLHGFLFFMYSSVTCPLFYGFIHVGGIAAVYSFSLSIVCIYHNIFIHSTYENCLLIHGVTCSLCHSRLQVCLKSIPAHILNVFLHMWLHINLQWTSSSWNKSETYLKHSSFISSTSHHTLRTLGILNYCSVENCKFTMFSCL